MFMAVLGVFSLFTACEQPADSDKTKSVIICNVTVTFNTNGGGSIANQTFTRGGTAARPAPDPAKTGYTFAGWYADSELSAIFNFSSPVTGETTIYAKWTPITYTAAFNKNETSAAGIMANQTFTYGVEQTLSANSFTRSGYTFTGWNTAADGGGTAYADGESVSNLASTQGATVTLYAKWKVLITNTADIAAYLNAETGGASAEDPVPLFLALELSAANWNDTLAAIDTAGTFISLDLAACTKSSASSGGGLRYSGDFDPLNSTAAGKAKIINLTLPALATGIVAGASGSAFQYCTALKTVSGAGVTSIGSYAFYGSSSHNGTAALTSASFPAATAIGDNVFDSCAALTSVSFPAAASIGAGAFRDCAALSSVSFPAAAAIGSHAFDNCAVLTSASFPAAAAIGDNVFDNCYALTSASFPALTFIGESAFSGCAALTTVTLGATRPALGFLILKNIPARTVTVRIPASANIIYGASSFSNTSTTNSWGRAFKGTGWNTGNSYWSGNNYYGTGVVNTGITLVFETY
jgi:uncharacterized repeat protein (TIGR02543 family)